MTLSTRLLVKYSTGVFMTMIMTTLVALIAENGKLVSLSEKPELKFKINSGMYILAPHLLKEIPGNQFFHITQLIENIQKRGGNVGVFPISSKS